MPNLRIRTEDRSDKLPLLVPGIHSTGPRSLVLQVNRLSRMVPSAQPFAEGVLPKIGDEPGQGQMPWQRTREDSYDFWRVDSVTLVNTNSIWLDDLGAGRLLYGRRSIIIVNQDLANAVWISHTQQQAAGGGYIAAGGSITLPFSDRAKLFGRSVAASSVISFYQFASGGR